VIHQESVILNNATREGNFINEPYIQQIKLNPYSVYRCSTIVSLCVLSRKNYAGVFTERAQVLYLLSTQAAIAIENAKLYLKAARQKSMTHFEAVPVVGTVDATGSPLLRQSTGN